MSVKTNVYDEREIRLACLKLAAEVAKGFKDPQFSIVNAAKIYYEWVAEDVGDDN